MASFRKNKNEAHDDFRGSVGKEFSGKMHSLFHVQEELQKQLHDLKSEQKELAVSLKNAHQSIGNLRIRLLKNSEFGDLDAIQYIGRRCKILFGLGYILLKIESWVRKRRIAQTVNMLGESGLFNARYYLSEYPDVAHSGLDPLEHFVTRGVFEGRRPNSHFDPVYYLGESPDVMFAGMNPLLHFYRYGWKEGRNPSEEFDTKFYLGSNQDVADEGENPLLHYLVHGKGEGRICKPLSQQREKKYFYCEPEKSLSFRDDLESFSLKPKISIIMPVYNVDPHWLSLAIQSVEKQWYSKWELCIVDDRSTNPDTVKFLYEIKHPQIKIKFLSKNKNISGASNEAISMASGEYIALMDNDDELTADALYEVVRCINVTGAEFIYSDEDKIAMDGKFCDPHFKADFAPDMFLSQNYLSHLGVIKKSLIDMVAGFTVGLEGAQDYDLYLKVLEKTDKISHIPKVLYHWRKIPGSTAAIFSDKSYAQEAGRKALEKAMTRRGIDAAVVDGVTPGTYRIRYAIKGNPLVSIIIPFKDKPDLLERCVESILNVSTYDNLQIIGISNNSEDDETFQVMKKLTGMDSRVSFFVHDIVFNYSALNNYAVKHYVKGEHIVLLNNDIEIISPDWLESMLEFSQREDVGAVGAKLYYPNDTIQHAGLAIGVLALAGHNFRHKRRDDPCYMGRSSVVQNVSAVTAACMMVKKSLYNDISGLDEKYLAVAFNDVDFCLRLQEKGFVNVYTPYCEAYHYESISRGSEDTPEKQQRFKNEVLFMQERHSAILDHGDPYYNPNLSLEREDFGLK